MGIIVQKFGGSSVSATERREQVLHHVTRALKENFQVVVVVSAMGRQGDPYATDTLLGLTRGAPKDLDRREQDMLMACGEIISAVVMAQTLRNHGYPAVALTGGQAGILTDDDFGGAHIREIYPGAITRYLDQGKIVVVAGFQGITENGDSTTLGRGGSDTTASALGVALRAEVVEIYTDVDGVKTADPHLVEGAKTLREMTYREVAEMAHLGAKVMHPRSVEIAMEGGIPLKIRSTFSDDPGTVITSEAKVLITGDRLVTGITHLTSLAQVRVHSHEDFNAEQRALRIFQGLADQRVSLDMIHLSPDLISFVVPETDLENTLRIIRDQGFAVDGRAGLAKVSAVGAGMRGIPGVMARVVEALNRIGVTIFQTTDSHANISCLVQAQEVSQAVRALHDEFRLGA